MRRPQRCSTHSKVRVTYEVAWRDESSLMLPVRRMRGLTRLILTRRGVRVANSVQRMAAGR